MGLLVVGFCCSMLCYAVVFFLLLAVNIHDILALLNNGSLETM